MSDKAKSRLMIAGAALCAALFLFSGAMLAREYLDQKQSAEAFAEVADLVKEDVEPPTLELADDSAPEPEELTAFEKYADVYAQNSDLVGWITVPGTRIDYIAECKALALYDTGVSAEYGDQLITLSTCEYSRTNGRMVVVAKLLEE